MNFSNMIIKSVYVICVVLNQNFRCKATHFTFTLLIIILEKFTNEISGVISANMLN